MPVVAPSGGLNVFPLLAGEVLSVVADASATGRVVLLDAAGALDEVLDVAPSATLTRGPYALGRTVRVYTRAGSLSVGTSVVLRPPTALAAPPTISSDRLEVSGAGAKPDSSVTVLAVDTGATLGVVTADGEGDWLLSLATPLEAGLRVSYEMTVASPWATASGAEASPLDLSQPLGPGVIPVL